MARIVLNDDLWGQLLPIMKSKGCKFSKNNRNVMESAMLVNNENGSAFVFVLVFALLITYIFGYSTSLLSSIQKSSNQFVLKSQMTFLNGQIKEIFSRIEDCTCQVRGLGPFNGQALGSQKIVLNTILSSGAMDVGGNCIAPILIDTNGNGNYKAGSIFIDNIAKKFGNDEYEALLHYSVFNDAEENIEKEPIKFSFYTDPLSPISSKIIRGCGYSPAVAPTISAVPLNTKCEISFVDPTASNKQITFTVKASTNINKVANSDLSLSCSTNNSKPNPTCIVSGLTNNTTYYFSSQSVTLNSSSPFRPDRSNPADLTPDVSCTPTSPTDCAGAWSACSVTCGTGQETYSVTVPATQGGKSCPFNNGDTRSCVKAPCPGNWVLTLSTHPNLNNKDLGCLDTLPATCSIPSGACVNVPTGNPTKYDRDEYACQ